MQKRGESMAAAAKIGKAHGMLSVIGLDDKTMEDVCSKACATVGGETVCQIANYLFPTGRVVSGHKSALDEACVPSRTRTNFTAAVNDPHCHGDGESLPRAATGSDTMCQIPATHSPLGERSPGTRALLMRPMTLTASQAVRKTFHP